MRSAIAAALFLLLATGSAAAKDIRLTTWNVGWLTDRAASVEVGQGRRPIYQRTAADYALLRGYVDRLRPDILAMQEVDGADAAAHLVDPEKFEILTTDETDIQRPVLAVRKGRGVTVTQHADVAALDLLDGQPRSLRRGLDATVTIGKRSLRILIVHLKSGCFSPAQHGEACDQISRQAPIVQAWIDARQAEGRSFVVMGDFNRRLGNPADPIRQLLDDGPMPLTWLHDAPAKCWGGKYPDPIDHIVLGEGVRAKGKAHELVYRETDPAYRDRLSDHCPVSVTLSD